MMAAPSSTPGDLHLAREPRRQTATARSRDKANRKRIQCTTSEKLRSQDSVRQLASCLKTPQPHHQADHPLIDTMG